MRSLRIAVKSAGCDCEKKDSQNQAFIQYILLSLQLFVGLIVKKPVVCLSAKAFLTGCER